MDQTVMFVISEHDNKGKAINILMLHGCGFMYTIADGLLLETQVKLLACLRFVLDLRSRTLHSNLLLGSLLLLYEAIFHLYRRVISSLTISAVERRSAC